MSKFSSKAFSLAEMALVIVIIGILVAAIVGGKELIAQAKIKKVASEYTVLNQVVQSFRSMYDNMPGDLPNAYDYYGDDCDTLASYCNGDGDGMIEGVTSLSETAPYHNDNESMRVFQHLYLAELIIGSFTGVGYDSGDDSSCGDEIKLSIGDNACSRTRNINVYPTSYSNSGYYFLYYDNNLGHVIQLGDTNSTNNDTVNGPNNDAILVPRFAYKIDKKFDDGVPNSGLTTAVFDLDEEESDDSCYNEDGEYNVSLVTIECGLKMAFK